MTRGNLSYTLITATYYSTLVAPPPSEYIHVTLKYLHAIFLACCMRCPNLFISRRFIVLLLVVCASIVSFLRASSSASSVLPRWVLHCQLPPSFLALQNTVKLRSSLYKTQVLLVFVTVSPPQREQGVRGITRVPCLRCGGPILFLTTTTRIGGKEYILGTLFALWWLP